MTFEVVSKIRAVRKPHRCAYCGHRLVVGSPAIKKAGVWDGDFYSNYGHEDCLAMWNAAYNDYSDGWEGMAFNLLDAIGSDESFAIKRERLDDFRGHFPHVVTRLDYNMQMAEVRHADEYRKRGLVPDPEDCPPLYS